MIKLMFADDEELVRSGLRAMMSGAADIEIVGEASDGRSAVEVARRYHPDVALLDIKMRSPDDGIRALRAILALPDPPTVAMLTTFDIDDYVSLALRLGANGFLLKDIDPAALLRAVRDLARGGAVLDPGVAARMVQSHRDEQRAAQPARKLLASLSDREREVVGLIGQGLSNAEIGGRLHLSEATVKGYVSAVLSKIGAANRVQAALLAYRGGLLDQ
ncbi:response regulator [Amycolatopsis regifaucium]|uniref:DNA-binding response regulator n=1 Tax=Amycolatopsis regifaucium TaxID=546365 RepID=A0A154MTH0_9PSEU|nr:response regulator transcription factor [Amycolatopsis regifaucium]KZB87400.1 two-component system response regulator [Amycolatopsis regifaucium]OKA08235.1 DNA-binding response regulator [Amycolatopsis regifaucium]SFI44690.1 DNA-binding response regulator, NarL/FixJ family, contains REC and HTH domains [Amycolatopsis regifaucium]